MPIQRGSQKIIKRYRGSQEILASYRGDQKVYSSIPVPVLFAEFPSGDLLRNSGSAGGQFALAGASPGARPPYGAWIPEATYLIGEHSEVAPGGCTVMGWFKSSKALSNRAPVGAINGDAYAAFVQTSSDYSGDLRIQVGNASYTEVPIPGAIAYLGAWIHVAASLESSGGQTRYTAYVNGEQALTGTVDGSIPPSFSFVYIGQGWEGDAGRVRLFSGGALTPSQVASFYNAERDIYPIAAPLPPRYAASDISNTRPPRMSKNVWTTITSHTVPRDGISSGQWNVRHDYVYNGGCGIRVLKNGEVVATLSTTSNPQSRNYPQSVSIPDMRLNAGDLVAFQALSNSAQAASGGYIDYWSWSLS